MIIKKLVLRNFRNYNCLSLEFEKGINVIVGENAVGKTNIVEAIYFLSLARSFRTNESPDLIMKSCQFATIEACVEQLSIKKEMRAILTPSGKKITCNSKSIKRITDLASLVNVILFEPKDVLMFADSPSTRRKFLDISLSKKSSAYLECLMKFERLLKERNCILKNDNIDMTQLDVVTNQLIEIETEIIKFRSNYISGINRVLSKIVFAIKGEHENAQIVYEPFVRCDENFASNAKRMYEKNLESDLKHKVTQIGIHREDMKMLLNGGDISSYGSQGENRIVVIALLLAPYFLIDEEGAKPIVILDDVMSELDKTHRERLIAFLKKFEQVFITSTNTNIKNASIYEVKEHAVTRRNA